MNPNLRRNARELIVALAAQAIWVVMVAGSTAALLLLFGTTNLHRIIDDKVSIPAWSVLISAVLAMIFGFVFRSFTKKASAVHGRVDATKANLNLLNDRQKVSTNERVVRSTRFGRWPQEEVLTNRASFRQEIDRMVLDEGCDLRRIWNVSSLDDAARLREMLEKYKGHANHSIRAFFQLPDFVLPELLIVDKIGATMSFPSTRSPFDLDWSVLFRRNDIVIVVRDYFDVMWDRAERMLDAGEITDQARKLLDQVEVNLQQTTTQASGDLNAEHL